MPLQAHLVICHIAWEAAPMAPRCTWSESCNPAVLRVMGWLRERLPAAHVPFSFSNSPGRSVQREIHGVVRGLSSAQHVTTKTLNNHPREGQHERLQ